MNALPGIPPSIPVEPVPVEPIRTEPISVGPVLIEPMTPADWPAVRRIYAAGIATGQATFETEAPGWDAWNRAHLPLCRLVARAAGSGNGNDSGRDGDGSSGSNDGGNNAGGVLAWAALAPVSGRACYAGVAEHSIYVDAAARGRGIGKRLLGELARQSEAAGIWTLQSSVFPENAASIAVHLACGFRILGRRKRVAMHNGVWRDTVIMERRSNVAGLDEATTPA